MKQLGLLMMMLVYLGCTADGTSVTGGDLPDGDGADSGMATGTDTGLPEDDDLNEDPDDGLPPPPVFSHPPGFYAVPFSLSMEPAGARGRIVYTLDGSQPDPDNLTGTPFQYKNSYPGSFQETRYTSLLYEEPIAIVDRTFEPEIMAGFVGDYDGYRIHSGDPRLFKGTVIRAVSVEPDGTVSRETAGTWWVHERSEQRYSLPVLSLAVQTDHFYDYDVGMYTPGRIWDEQGEGVRNGGAPANYHERGDGWERRAHLELFDHSVRDAVIAQHIGVRIHGGWSRALPMKSLRIYARNRYGATYLAHPVFPDRPYGQYKRLILRNSGNDWAYTLFRDAAIQMVMSPLQVDLQAYRPIVLFINGEYWGIHNIRERYDLHYLERTYGVSRERVDLLTGDATVKEGTGTHYWALLDFIAENGVAQETHYAHIRTLMDIDNYIDYQIAHIFARNTDWPGNNVDFWRYRTLIYEPHAPYGQDGRWRWMVFDTDFGFGIWNNDASHNTLSFAAQVDGPEWPNPDWSTFLFRHLLMNSTFRHQFVNRFADLLNTAFQPQRVISIIRNLQQILEPEMAEHIRRWQQPSSVADWRNEVEKMVEFAQVRTAIQQSHIRTHFDLDGTFRIRVDVSDSAHGHVRVNSVDIRPETPGISSPLLPWEGTYFAGISVPLEAVAAPGRQFSHWEGISGSDSRVTVNGVPNGTVTAIAHFR